MEEESFSIESVKIFKFYCFQLFLLNKSEKKKKKKCESDKDDDHGESSQSESEDTEELFRVRFKTIKKSFATKYKPPVKP